MPPIETIVQIVFITVFAFLAVKLMFFPRLEYNDKGTEQTFNDVRDYMKELNRRNHPSVMITYPLKKGFETIKIQEPVSSGYDIYPRRKTLVISKNGKEIATYNSSTSGAGSIRITNGHTQVHFGFDKEWPIAMDNRLSEAPEWKKYGVADSYINAICPSQEGSIRTCMASKILVVTECLCHTEVVELDPVNTRFETSHNGNYLENLHYRDIGGIAQKIDINRIQEMQIVLTDGRVIYLEHSKRIIVNGHRFVVK